LLRVRIQTLVKPLAVLFCTLILVGEVSIINRLRTAQTFCVLLIY
jgi:hypothetical protein